MTIGSNSPALVVIKGPTKDKVFPLSTNLVTVGRGDDADIRLTGDQGLSRVHLNLRLVNNRYLLTNKSNYGTLVNDRVADEKEVANGDRIRIGELYLLEYADGSKPVTAPRTSLFRRPAVLAMIGVYGIGLVAAMVFLSNAPTEEEGLDSSRVTAVLSEYGQYM